MLTQLIRSRTTEAETKPTAGETALFEDLECLVELRSSDKATGVQYRDCLIDYTTCPNRNCIKKLL